MIFIDKMKDFKIYKKPFYLPTVEKDKKKKSVIALLTPNYESSRRLIVNNLTINKLRFQSYYLLKDVNYCIHGKDVKAYEEDDFVRECTVEEIYQNLLEMSSKERNQLPDSAFGLPKKRKYPLDTPDRVKSAIRFFNYVDKEDEVELAANINKAIKKFKMTDIHVGKKNRFYNYYKPINESVVVEEDYETPINNLSSFIGFTGYMKDIKEVTDYVTPELYYDITTTICSEFHKIKSLEDIPILMVNVGATSPDEINYEASLRTVIPVMINGKDNIARDVYSQVIEFYRPEFKGTIIPNMIAEHFLNIPSYNRRYTEYIFNEKNLTPDELLHMSVNDVFKTIREKFNISDMDQHYINESADYIPLHEESMDDSISISVFNEDDVKSENGLIIDNTIFFFNEAMSPVDSNLKKLLYLERLKKRSDVLEKLVQVRDVDFKGTIKYAYPDLKRYQTRNIFYDLYYYNELFFKNNTLPVKKKYEAYLTLLERFITNPELKENGYQKLTLFIPILDWNYNRSTRMWIYREAVNPISIIYELMRTESPKLKAIFKNIDVIFFGADKYFKINFSKIDDIKKMSVKFRMFITKIANNEEFDYDDIDTSMDNKETPETIKTDLIDQIDVAKGIDLTAKVADAQDKYNIIANEPVHPTAKEYKKRQEEIKKLNSPLLNQAAKDDKENDITLSKDTDKKKIEDKEDKLNKMATTIVQVSNRSGSTDEAIDDLDNQEDFKQILVDIDSMSDNGPSMDATRAARMNKLNNQFLDQEIQGTTVKELLNQPKEKEIPVTKLNISTPNNEWSELTYTNFDKNYNLDADIVACFYHLSKTSRPISIRKLTATDVSTSEDRLMQYSADMEDYRGKRFNVKLDIPIMKDNRLRLRGNDKAMQIQLFNMPIIKTDFDTCQVVTNYRKIFIHTFNDSVAGRSNSMSAAIIKAIEKAEDKNIKVTLGENSKICNKYVLPIDYIDLASYYTKIETPKHIFYFDQDMIRNEHADIIPNSDDSIPIIYDKENKKIISFTMNNDLCSAFIATELRLDSSKFADMFDTLKWANSGTYARCKILGKEIPLILICGYIEGLTKTLQKAKINFTLSEKMPSEVRNDLSKICIKFKDGYLWCDNTYLANMLLNGLKETSIDMYSFTEIDNRNTYYELLDDYGGRSLAGGLENFKDCLVDPITEEVLQHYKLPTDFTSILLYATNLLCDNKYVKHTDMSSRRIRRYEQIAAYTYEALSEAYDRYANALRQGKNLPYSVKQSIVIDKVLMTQNTNDDNTANALGSLEETNTVTYKGKAGLNSKRSYSIDKRVYDSSMINILATSTNFAAAVGENRQATMNMAVVNSRGYLVQTNGNTSDMNSAKALCATEALTPFGATHDDPMRTNMTFIQTSKHSMRTIDSDPLLVTCGADDALPYLTLDKFAFKSKEDGEVTEVTDDYILIHYKNGKREFINLKPRVEKNSANGFYVPIKLDKAAGIKVGSKVKNGQIIAYDSTSFSNSVGESDDISYNIGKLAKVAILSTDDGFEDSGFCTERLSKSLSTKVVMLKSQVIDKDASIFKIAKVGDHVEPEDNLLVWQTAFDDEEASAFATMVAGDGSDDNLLGKKTIKSNITGTIVDIKIYRTVDVKDLSPTIQKVVKAYEAPINELKKKLESEGIDSKNLPATYKLEPTGKLKKAQEAIYVEFYLEYTDRVAIGDKIVYFAANKAVIKDVISDTLAPYTDFRRKEPIDAFVSQISVDKRIVTSTLITGGLNKLCIELDRSIKDILNIKYDESTV